MVSASRGYDTLVLSEPPAVAGGPACQTRSIQVELVPPAVGGGPECQTLRILVAFGPPATARGSDSVWLRDYHYATIIVPVPSLVKTSESNALRKFPLRM